MFVSSQSCTKIDETGSNRVVLCKLMQLARVEVDYHQRALEMLELLVPQLEEAVGMQHCILTSDGMVFACNNSGFDLQFVSTLVGNLWKTVASESVMVF